MSSVYTPEHVGVQYVVESTYGTIPATPAFIWIGILQDVKSTADMNKILLRGLGDVDVQYIRSGMQKHGIEVTFVPQDDTGSRNFIDYALTFPTGLSIEVFADSTSDVYVWHKGCLADRLELRCSEEDWVKILTKWICQDIDTGTAGKTGETHDSDGREAPMHWHDLRLDMDIDQNGTFETELDIAGNVSFTVNNNLKSVPVIRSTNSTLLKYLVKRQREITGEIGIYFEDKTYLDYVLTNEVFDLRWSLDKADAAYKPYFTFTDVEWNLSRLSARIGEVPCQISLPFTAKTVTMTKT